MIQVFPTHHCSTQARNQKEEKEEMEKGGGKQKGGRRGGGSEGEGGKDLLFPAYFDCQNTQDKLLYVNVARGVV